MLSKKAALLALLVAAGLAGLAVGLRRPLLRLAARHWTQKLQTAPDEQIEPLLRQAAAWGEEGVPVLVNALGSAREPVARAGRRVVFAELDRWKRLPIRERTARLAILAQTLARRVEQFGPTARSDAAELAARILLWPLDSETTNGQEVIAACDTILQTVHAPRHRVAGGAALSEPGEMPGALPSAGGEDQSEPGSDAVLPQEVPFPGAAQDAPQDRPVAEMARLPGGGLPIERFPTPPGEKPGAVSAARRLEDEPGLFSRPPDARRLGPGLPSSAAEQGVAEPDDQTPGVDRPTQPDRAQTTILNGEMRLGTDASGADAMASGTSGRAAAPAAVSSPGGQHDSLGGFDALELMRRLHDQDQAAAGAARAELARRGFGPRELELARRLTDPRPEVRRELAQVLPGLAGVDAVVWLRWLSRDQNAEVRLAAVTVMATTGDPALLREIEKIALQDPDPRVRQAAVRLADRRRAELR